ncbi:MAG TPA: putative Ig domain-containing protein, partial [Blastocatellia bacterium]|nr:putative Ig domain-containing protein [Blastocatellia bacterium]
GATTFSLNSGTLPTGLTLSAVGVLSGTPTQSGTFNLTIKATDSNGCTGTSTTYALVIGCQTITVTNPVTTNGVVNTALTRNFTQTGGVGTITFSLNSGALPNGLVLSSAGVLSGTPTQSGSFSVTVKATDGNGCFGIGATYTLVISCQTISLTNPATTTGTVNTAFSQSFMQTGGVGATTFSLNSGTSPTGLTLSAGGVLSGTPTQSGTFNLTIKATDSNGCTGTSATYALVIGCQTINVTNPATTTGTVNAAFSQTFTQTGGVGATTFSLNSGPLPTGLTLSTGGLLSGTPTQRGSFPIVIKATDSNGCFGNGATYILAINCPTISLNPGTLPNGQMGATYNQPITASGGVGAYTFGLSSGALPTGITLSSAGLLSGTPTVAGSFPITITATDANNCTSAQGYTLVIASCPVVIVNPATASNGFVGTSYSQSFTQTGGTGTVTWSNTGSLPGGLTLNLTSGVLSGTPTTQNTFNFTIRATDSNGCFGERAYTVTISANSNGLQFYPLPQPVRLLETRAGLTGCTTPGAIINAGATFTLPARTTCAGIPANAQAVTGNITVVPTGGGFLTLFPSSAQQPTVANSNFGPGEVTNNVFTVGLGAADGAFKIFASGTTHVIVDVTGYYAPPAAGGLYFHPLATPVRLLETRAGLNGCIAPGAQLIGTGDPNADPNLDFAVQGRSPVASPCNSIPATAQVLVGNAT